MKNRVFVILFTLISPCIVNAQSWWLSSDKRSVKDNNTGLFFTHDSTVYFYSSNITPGHTKILDTVWYDSSNSYSGVNGLQLARSIRTYTPDGQISTEAVYGEDWPNSGLVLQTADTYQYTNGKLTEHLHHDVSHNYIPFIKTSYTYNSSGLIVAQKVTSWVKANNKWENYSEHYYSYNNNGLILTDSSIVLYAPGGSLSYIKKNYYTYNTRGELDVIYTLQKGSAGFDTTERALYVYDNNSVLMSDTIQLYKGVNSWMSVVYQTYQYNISGELTSVVKVRIDGYETGYTVDFKEANTYTYNTLNQLVQHHLLTQTISDTIDDRYHYYSYSNTRPADITVTSGKDNQLSLSPVPVNGLLHIRYHSSFSSMPNFCITDMQGRVVQQWQDKAAVDYHKQINTADMPAGVYMLTINTGEQQIARQFIVSR